MRGEWKKTRNVKRTHQKIGNKVEGGTMSERTGLRNSKKMICELELNSGEDRAVEKPKEELSRQMEQCEFKPDAGKRVTCLRNSKMGSMMGDE